MQKYNIKCCHKKNEDLNPDEQYYTPLVKAINKNNKRKVFQLLKNTELNVNDLIPKLTPLQHAVKLYFSGRCDIKIIVALLQHPLIDIYQISRFSNNAIVETIMHTIWDHAELDLLDILFDHPQFNVNKTCRMFACDMTLLEIASGFGHTASRMQKTSQVCEKLLYKGANISEDIINDPVIIEARKNVYPEFAKSLYFAFGFDFMGEKPSDQDKVASLPINIETNILDDILGFMV